MTGGGSAVGYLFVPLVSALAIVGLALILRWAQSPGKRIKLPSYGMLVPVARCKDQHGAEVTAARLRAEGIRASVTHDVRGWLVLAWKTQADVARAWVASRQSPHHP
ncbi:hypothetical protein FE697_009590 [Mumia zhuanghuii]|uniref:Uncharacterized protein n=2 Tax=Mumia TaxID=1546255 RepID=A0ABW1QRA8_9ACTN|nr:MULTISPECIES: hypothetical protein [Mumia]KAA1423805.1 hypothetical protein FE697_009590 [Mumia zhuanghuii]